MFINKFNKKNLIPIGFSVAVILLAAVSIGGIRAVLLAALRQPLRILTFVRRETGAVIFFHRNFIAVERLQKESGVLRLQLAKQEELRQENERLKNLLAFKSEATFRMLPARVIGRSTDSWASTIVIDRGGRSGIRPGLAVVTYSGLLGRVIESAQETSTIMLISDPNIGVSGMVQRSREEGLISGTLGRYLVMRYLPQDADIQAGDTVVTSGMNQVYPKGLLLGTVVDTAKDTSGLSMHAVLRPAVNMSALEEVMVIMP